nr:TonB-dependent receptor [Bacteroidia bacterium]
MYLSKHVISWLFFLIIIQSVTAQTKISGTVTDQKNNPVAGANIVIRDSYDGASSDASGKFQFTSDETGDVIIVCSLIGFSPSDKKIKLQGDAIEINFKLKETSNELNTVTITAGAFEASDEKKMVILRPLDIVTTAGSQGDIYGALQTLPGTQPTQDQEGLFVRGGDAAEAKTLIDGIEVANPYFSSVPDVPQRSRFSPFMFKGTNFSTGGYSAQYGQAMSSVLALESEDLPPRSIGNIGIM